MCGKPGTLRVCFAGAGADEEVVRQRLAALQRKASLDAAVQVRLGRGVRGACERARLASLMPRGFS